MSSFLKDFVARNCHNARPTTKIDSRIVMVAAIAYCEDDMVNL